MAKHPPLFTKDQLPDETGYSMSDVDFANYFVRFVRADFTENLFTKRFYQRLMYAFSHIAHYNCLGFYDAWFCTTADRVRFLEYTLRPPFGAQSPVERAIQGWLRDTNTLAQWRTRRATEQEACERNLLTALKHKYESEATPVPVVVAPAEPPAPVLPTPAPTRARKPCRPTPVGRQSTRHGPMRPTFYFAIGARARPRDLEIALAVGQRDFLIPIGATLTQRLQALDGVRVVLDSAAWPIHNPRRPSLDAYVRHLLTWRRADGWGNLAWCAAYDHIGDPARTQREYHTLLAQLAAAGAADCPVVPVTHYPARSAEAILLDMEHGLAGTRHDLADHDGAPGDRPCYGIGGLVPVLSPTRPHTVRSVADHWVTAVLRDLNTATSGPNATIDPALVGLHLFGIGQPAFTLRSPLVASFDSSGPARQASFGWKTIRPHYTDRYGLSPEQLQMSREARLAYWICVYRAAVGLPFQHVDPALLMNDTRLPPAVQLSLLPWLAA